MGLLEVNPLSVHGLRRLNYCPVHFARIEIEQKASQKKITDWIYENLRGRFCLNNQRDTKAFQTIMVLGFEDHAEATLMSLQLNEINRV